MFLRQCVENATIKKKMEKNKKYYLFFLCESKLKEFDITGLKENIITYKWVGYLKISNKLFDKAKNSLLTEKDYFLLKEKSLNLFCEALKRKGYIHNIELYNSFYFKNVKFLRWEWCSFENLNSYLSFFIKEYHTVTTTQTRVGVNLKEEAVKLADGDFNGKDWIDKKGCWFVYQHLSPTGKSYIGITQQSPEDRWRKGNGYRKQEKFYNAIKKYGWDSFQHNILEENINEETASYWEKYYIKKFDSYYNGYNATEGGLNVYQ